VVFSNHIVVRKGTGSIGVLRQDDFSKIVSSRLAAEYQEMVFFFFGFVFQCWIWDSGCVAACLFQCHLFNRLMLG
jgi:hypothetical protein